MPLSSNSLDRISKNVVSELRSFTVFNPLTYKDIKKASLLKGLIFTDINENAQNFTRVFWVIYSTLNYPKFAS